MEFVKGSCGDWCLSQHSWICQHNHQDPLTVGDNFTDLTKKKRPIILIHSLQPLYFLDPYHPPSLPPSPHLLTASRSLLVLWVKLPIFLWSASDKRKILNCKLVQNQETFKFSFVFISFYLLVTVRSILHRIYIHIRLERHKPLQKGCNEFQGQRVSRWLPVIAIVTYRELHHSSSTRRWNFWSSTNRPKPPCPSS